MNTVGQILLIARNSKNLSISDISIELKISKSIIIDLENDNIKNDSDIIFNIGHLRSYSNFLELDTDLIIKKFKDEIPILPIWFLNIFGTIELFTLGFILFNRN